MRSASGTLKTFLATKQPWWSADLFTITLSDGTVLRYASSGIPITYGGNTWLATGPLFQRSSWKMAGIGDTSEMVVQINTNGADYTANFKLIAHNGYLDGATVLLQRAVMAVLGDTTMGIVTMFSGRVSQIDIDGIGVKMSVKAPTISLQQQFPRNRYTAGCMWTLYGTGCGLTRATWTAANTVGASGITNTSVPTPGNWILPSTVIAPMSELILGTFKIISGAGAGQARPIVGGTSSAGTGYILLGYPLYTLPAPGDSIIAVLGCNRSKTVCTNVFGNSQNYRGFDYIPPAETAF